MLRQRYVPPDRIPPRGSGPGGGASAGYSLPPHPNPLVFHLRNTPSKYNLLNTSVDPLLMLILIPSSQHYNVHVYVREQENPAAATGLPCAEGTPSEQVPQAAAALAVQLLAEQSPASVLGVFLQGASLQTLLEYAEKQVRSTLADS